MDGVWSATRREDISKIENDYFAPCCGQIQYNESVKDYSTGVDSVWPIK